MKKSLFVLGGLIAMLAHNFSELFEVSPIVSERQGIFWRVCFLVLLSVISFFSYRSADSRRNLFIGVLIGKLSQIISGFFLIVLKNLFSFSLLPLPSSGLWAGDGWALMFGRLYLTIPYVLIQIILFVVRFIELRPKRTFYYTDGF